MTARWRTWIGTAAIALAAFMAGAEPAAAAFAGQDNGRIAFIGDSSACENETEDVMWGEVTSPAGGQYSFDGSASNPRWSASDQAGSMSPDGTRILFWSDRSGDGEHSPLNRMGPICCG